MLRVASSHAQPRNLAHNPPMTTNDTADDLGIVGGMAGFQNLWMLLGTSTSIPPDRGMNSVLSRGMTGLCGRGTPTNNARWAVQFRDPDGVSLHEGRISAKVSLSEGHLLGRPAMPAQTGRRLQRAGYIGICRPRGTAKHAARTSGVVAG